MVYDRRPDDMERITTPELAKAFIEEQVEAVKAQVGDGKVLLALSPVSTQECFKEAKTVKTGSKFILRDTA